MKKSFTKYLSAFLALVLFLFALPMAAFAAEHDLAPCATCTHNFDVTSQLVLDSHDDQYHYFATVDYYECTKCSYSFTVNRSDVSLVSESHTFVKRLLAYMVDIEGNKIPVYNLECTKCGYTKAA